MPVNDYPLLFDSVMLTVTRIESINHHSLLRGITPSLSLKYSNFTLDNDLVNTSVTCSSSGNVLELHNSLLHHITDILVFDLYVLGLVMEYWIL